MSRKLDFRGEFKSARSRVGAEPSWAAVGSLAIGIFSMVSSEFLPATLLTPISHDLGISTGLAGQTVTVTAVIAAIAAPTIVMATARLNRRLVVCGLMLLIVLSNLLAALAPNVWILLTARVGMGIALGGTWALAAALVMRLVPPHLLPRATAIVFGGIAAATVCAPSLGAYLGELWGWRTAFLLVAGLGMLALITQIITMPSLEPQPYAGIGAFRLLLRRRSILIGFVAVLLMFSGHFAGFTYLRIFLEKVTALNVETLSLALFAFGVAGLLGNFAGGILAERSVKIAIFSAAMLLVAASSVLFFQGSFAVIAFMAVGVWGGAFGALPVGTQIWTTQAGADHAESAGALLVITTQGAIAIGAFIGGLLIDSFGIYSVVGYCALAALLGGSVILAEKRS